MGKGNVFVPVRDTEKSWKEGRGDGGDLDAAHRAFDNPHTLHRGKQVDFGSRDSGENIKRGPPTMLKNEKGQWYRPDRETLKKMREEWEREQERLSKKNSSKSLEPLRTAPKEKFIPAKTWDKERPGYYFGTAVQGTGYYWDQKMRGDIHESALAVSRDRSESPKRRKSRERSRSRERRRSRDRSRSRERSSRYHERSRSRERKRSSHRRSRSRSNERRRSRSRSRDRDSRHAERREAVDKKVEVSGSGGNGGGEMSKADREKAAMERLLAARATGQGGRPGGVPRPSWGR